MMRLALCLVLLASAALAQTLSQGERDYAMSALHASGKRFLDTIAPLSEAQMKWKPAPDKWSVAEVAEHITVLEVFFPQKMEQVMSSPAAPEKKKASPGETDRKLMQAVTDRSHKFQAPELIRPTGRYATKSDEQAAFKQARFANIATVRDSQGDMRSHFAPHPIFGELDAYQWYIILAGHTDRHVDQILEIMATEGFPKQ